MSSSAVKSDGMPLMTPEELSSSQPQPLKTLTMMGAATAIGTSIAFGLSFFTTSPATERAISVAAEYNLAPLFLSGVVLAKAVAWVNFYPLAYKSGVMKRKSGNLRANMHVYKVLSSENEDESKAAKVVLCEDGNEGKYNRANRSLTHMTETIAGQVITTLLAGVVYPTATLVCTIGWATGRIMHQCGYAEKGYGSHGTGFALSTLASEVVSGLVLVAAAKTAMATE